MSRGHVDADGADERSLLARQALDVGVYAGLVVAATLVVAGVVGEALSANAGCGPLHGLVIAKRIMFFLGFLVLGAGAFVMRPRSPIASGDSTDGADEGEEDDERRAVGPSAARRDDREGGSPGPVQRLVDRVVSGLSVHVPPNERVSTGWKVVAAGLTVLAVTVVMELAGIHLVNFPC